MKKIYIIALSFLSILFGDLFFNALQAVTVIGQQSTQIITPSRNVTVIHSQQSNNGAEFAGACVGAAIGSSMCELIKNRSQKKKKNQYAKTLENMGYSQEEALAIAWAPTSELQLSLFQKAQQRKFYDSIWQMKADYPDAEEVLSVTNMHMLETIYHDIAMRIKNINDIKAQQITAYRAIKELGIYSIKNPESKLNEHKKEESNISSQSYLSLSLFYHVGFCLLLFLLCMTLLKILLRS